jgi:hypothetical protein
MPLAERQMSIGQIGNSDPDRSRKRHGKNRAANATHQLRTVPAGTGGGARFA